MILAVVLLTLAVAVIVIAVLARRKPAAERREAAGEAEADTFIGELRAEISPYFDDPGERMADTDIRRRYDVAPPWEDAPQPARVEPTFVPNQPVATRFAERPQLPVDEPEPDRRPDYVKAILRHADNADNVESMWTHVQAGELRAAVELAQCADDHAGDAKW